MSLLVIATVPIADFGVVRGEVCRVHDSVLAVDGREIPISQGTSAMLGAALAVDEHLDLGPTYALLAGDIGRGDGTRALYNQLEQTAEELQPTAIAFHYLQPVMAFMRRAVSMLEERFPDVPLIADAGGMYAAKAAGLARSFDLMTPDAGEISFLADPAVTHPAYVSHYLFGNDDFDPRKLARLAFEHGGSPQTIIIKGATDYVTLDGAVYAQVDDPCVPELEAIGGTGDTITGMAAAFMAAGFPPQDAALCAARANRTAGYAMGPRVDKRAGDLIAELPDVFRDNLCLWSGCCSI